MSNVLPAIGSPTGNNWVMLWATFGIFGVAQVVLSYLICTPLERLAPLLQWAERQPMQADIIYTFFVRIVIFPLVAYFEYAAAYHLWAALLAEHNIKVPSPLFSRQPVISFLAAFVALDFSDYWRHRLSHRFGWWYGLHSVHHAETQMTFWSDDRSHVLEDVITYVWLIATGLLIGVTPMQFPFVILAFRFIGSLAHANTRVSYGSLGSLLIMSPRFHRAHHCPEIAGRKSCNFGTALPWWDILFGTAIFTDAARETGDPSADPIMSTGTWWQQQVAGFKRMTKMLHRH
jgi:sterol desaturase/sphingolipid hydroxylase (fatty acid hydroxylase superfamily)